MQALIAPLMDAQDGSVGTSRNAPAAQLVTARPFQDFETPDGAVLGYEAAWPHLIAPMIDLPLPCP